MSKSKMPASSAEELKEAPAEKKMITLYTHGKKFEIPADTDVMKYLKEKYPGEYKAKK